MKSSPEPGRRAVLLDANATAQPARKTRRTRLADEPFIGMWRDREDMQDSTAWVQSLRQHEWEYGA